MVRLARPRWVMFGLFFLLLAIKNAVSIDPCPTTAQAFNVTTTEEATDLATALNCSGGGTFDVEWEGAVIVEQTFAIVEGSVVTIAGVGSGAVADGNGTTQLFTVSNATLNLADFGLENGYGPDSGGAIWAGGADSVLSCSGTTTFNSNNANRGGAVSVEDGATAIWSGNTSFSRNTAGFSGGAVFVQTGSSLSWTGQTNFTRNEAKSDGGALRSADSIITFSGETAFAANTAGITAGTIHALNSVFFWEGVTSFEDSKTESISDGGGTVHSFGSVISWQGKTSFTRGVGAHSGALYAYGSNVSWGGETSFCDNEANLNGGALSIKSSSNVSWTGETLFCDNRVINRGGRETASFGGAMYVQDSNVSWNGTTAFTNNTAASGGAVFAEGVTVMAWGGASTFLENTGTTNGGAVALGTQVSVDLTTSGTNLSLTGNVAGVAGGAVYMLGTSFGITWQGARFISNSALNGGGVYSVACGTAITVYGKQPSEYVDCTFRNNTAVASGGAVESAVGVDIFSNTVFEANTAKELGGGLRLAGTATLVGCRFVGNSAGEAGPAVASIGTVDVNESSFSSDNSLFCPAGEFVNYTVEGTANDSTTDYYNSVCDGCRACSGDCPIDGIGTQECIAALENTVSKGVGDVSGLPITLETLEIDAGYWRSTKNSATILPCWNEDACLGGLTDAENYCDTGYRGAYCAICEGDYAPTLAYTCSKCSKGEGIAFAMVVLLVLVGAGVAVICHLVSKNHDDTTSRFKRLTEALPVQGLKTVVVAWQILTQFDSVANVTYAGVYGKFLDGISSIISFDLGLVLSAGCMVTTDYHDRLLISTLGPLVALAVLAVCFKVATQRNRGSEDALKSVRRKHFTMGLLVTFLVYSSVSSTVFRVFDCEVLDDGTDYLRADYTIECTTAKHRAFQVYGVFMILFYPIGIPVLYSIVLFKNRGVVQDRRHRSEPRLVSLEVTACLWKPYKPSRYYYEVVECARRVTLTGVVVFIYPNTAAQVAVTLVLAFVFVMVSESLVPYATREDAWLSRVGHVVVFLSMFQALVLKVDVSDESSDSQEVFGGVLLAANICMVAAVIAEAAMVVCSFCGRGDAAPKETVEPWARNIASNKNVVEKWDVIEVDGPPAFTGTVPERLA